MKKRDYLVVFSVWLVVMLWAVSTKTREVVKIVPKGIKTVYVDSCEVEIDSTFSPEALLDYIKELNISFPHIVYAQAQLESGNFTSRVYRSNSNLFGMRTARSRPTTSHGNVLGHANYKGDWRQSVIDYALWQAHHRAYRLRNDQEYYLLLQSSGYAQDQTYVNKVRIIVNRNK